MRSLASVTEAICQRLADEGVGYFDSSGAYPPVMDKPPVFIKRFPAEAADSAIAVNCYADEIQMNPRDMLRVVRFQIRVRAPFDADPLADQTHEALEALQTMFADLHVTSCHRQSIAQLGMDEQDRDERADNYQLVTRRD